MEKETRIDIIEIGRGYLGVLAISILMATGVVSGMYAGESYSFETNYTNPVYLVKDNSSNIIGLNVTLDSGNITISTVSNYQEDNFTLVFFDNTTREIIKEVNIGGGSRSRIVYVDRNVTVYVPQYIENFTVGDDVCSDDVCSDDIEPIKECTALDYVLFSLFIICIISLIVYIFKKLKNRDDINEDD